jgi:hypothetical protein
MRRGATGEIVKAKVVSSNHFGHEYDLTSVHREVLGYVINRFKARPRCSLESCEVPSEYLDRDWITHSRFR